MRLKVEMEQKAQTAQNETVLKQEEANQRVIAAQAVAADAEAYRRNTLTEVDTALIMANLTALVDANIHFYITFTGMSDEAIESFKKAMEYPFYTVDIFRDSFSIDLVDYDALHWEE